jgi:hypothetical protein
MYDPEISTLISDFIEQIQDAISDQNTIIWPESDLFVQLQRKEGKLTKDDGHTRCGYYFVHHERRCIYWLEGLELNPSVSLPLRNIRGDLTGYQTREFFINVWLCTRCLTVVKNCASKPNIGELPLDYSAGRCSLMVVQDVLELFSNAALRHT